MDPEVTFGDKIPKRDVGRGLAHNFLDISLMAQPQAVYATDEVRVNRTFALLSIERVFVVWSPFHHRQGAGKENEKSWY